MEDAVFEYQWAAGGSDIDGATASTYLLTEDEEGLAIQVRVSFTDDAGNGESLTSAETAQVAPRANSPAAGQPAISGTVRVGETLTADTSGISDADGLEDAVFEYQWSAGGSDIDGATESSHELSGAEVGKTIQVRVSFTDDAGNQELLTSDPTAEVVGPPLTVTLESAAASHDGQAAFTFEIRFSEEFSISYKTLRDHVFAVTGGRVAKAQRMDKPSNIPWRITVKPDGNGDVTVVLPVTTDCESNGAICTDDGRKLSNSLEFTVPGPN